MFVGLVIGWFFGFCFSFRQSGFHWSVSDGDIHGNGRNGNGSVSSDSDSVELMTLLTTPVMIFHFH